MQVAHPVPRNPVAPLRSVTHDIQYIGHYLVYPKRRSRHEAFEIFKKWLLAELALHASAP